jgi:hypothetical protein
MSIETGAKEKSGWKEVLKWVTGLGLIAIGLSVIF